MRLGGPLFDAPGDPDGWAAAVRRAGYGAAYCPVGPDADDATVQAYARAAERAGIVIAETGAWSNPLSDDAEEAKAAFDKCCRMLDLADRIGARCCVNIAGSRGARWDGPHPDNLSEETFDRIVEDTRAIIDTVKPRRADYTLETMPWIFPDSPASYRRLVEAIDRPRCAVHLDPVNLINCPSRAFDTRSLLRECFAELGPWIRSCHAKDIALSERLTVHLDEVIPGQGVLDYGEFLRGVEAIGPDIPVMLEHLKTAEEYQAAAEHIRAVAAREGVTLR